MFYRKKKPLYIFLAVSLAVMVAVPGVFCPPAGPTSALAADIMSSYQALKKDPTSQVFLDRLYEAGATEADLESFLNDLDGELRRGESLTEANFNSRMFSVLKEVVTWHPVIFKALSVGFPEEISYTLDKKELHPSLVPLRNAAADSLLGTTPPDDKSSGGGGGGGGGGGEGAPADRDTVEQKISDQLERGASRIELEPSGSSDEIVIPGSAIKKVNEADKELHLKFDAVKIKLPAGAISISEQARFSVSIKVVKPSQASKAVSALSRGQRLAGDIFEILASTDSSVQGLDFDKEVTVTLPYQASEVKAEEERLLDAYRFDEEKNKWVAMKGTVDRSWHTVTFSTSHFSQYAVLIHDPARDVKPASSGEDKSGIEPTTPVPVEFSDMKGHWAQEYVEKLAATGIVAGVSPERFEPNRQITRAEFATLLVRALELPATVQLKGRFDDVAAGAWYFAPVNAAADAGLVNGVSATRFEPNQAITREQLTVMIARAMIIQGKTITGSEDQLNIFQDQKQISSWARTGIATAVAAGMVQGRPDGTFAPLANATRAEAATLIYNLLN
jgi:lactocepin